MMWRDVVELIPQIVAKNGYGEEVEQDGIPRTVFANKKSVRQSEFYQAVAAGMKPEIVFEVMTIDYEEVAKQQDSELRQMKVKYNNRTYRLIRPYSANGERTELVCSIFPMEG